MEIASLRCFQHLSHTLHFGRTSRECHVSPSALTRVIQRLEEELGTALFVRGPRSVRLTESGRAFGRYASDVLARYDALRAEIAAGRTALRGTLRVFTTVTACYSLLPGILGRFRTEYPEVVIELETGYPVDALEQLQRGRIDVAVASVPERLPRAVSGKTVARTPLLFVQPAAPGPVASRLRGARDVAWEGVPVILPHAGATRAHVDAWFRARRVRPRIQSEVPGSEAIMSLVALGCGVGVVPKLVYDKSPLRGDVRVLQVDPELPDLRVAVCTARERRTRPLIRAFWECVDVGPGRAA